MRRARHVARTGEKRIPGFGGGNLRVRDYLEDPRVDGGVNIKMDLQEVECGGMDWIELA